MLSSVVCENPTCQTISARKPSQIARSTHHFCSRRCRSMAAQQATIQRCSLCKNTYPATLDYFNKGKRANGLYSACKPCQKLTSDTWYLDHRDEHLAHTKTYAQEHPEVKRKSVRTYRLRHPERKKLQQDQSNAKRRENGKAHEDYVQRLLSGKMAESSKRYRTKYPERLKESTKKHHAKLKANGSSPSLRWKKNSPEKYLNHSRVHTIGRQEMKRHGVTAMGLYARDGGKCHLCHRRVSLKHLSIDHIIPKSLGGPGTWENLAIAHLRCNVKRGVDRIPAQYRLF
jgi:5-methylcytosine-specific restriction endonuclease McrA